MTTGIISPESTICIQPVFGIEFELDKEGMSEVIEMFENIWNSRTEKEKILVYVQNEQPLVINYLQFLKKLVL